MRAGYSPLLAALNQRRTLELIAAVQDAHGLNEQGGGPVAVMVAGMSRDKLKSELLECNWMPPRPGRLTGTEAYCPASWDAAGKGDPKDAHYCRLDPGHGSGSHVCICGAIHNG